MARDLSPAMVSQVGAQVLRPIQLVKMSFDSGDLRLWSGIGPLVWNGETYTGSGRLLGFSGLEESADLQATSCKFTLSGVPVSILSVALVEDYQNRKVSNHFAVLDNAGALVADPYLIFKGKMDVMESQDSGSTCTMGLNAESDLVDLRVVRSRQYTAEDQKSYYPDDKGLDFISSIEDIEVTWGVGVKG